MGKDPLANSKAANRAEKSGKWMKRFDKLGKAMGVLNVGMSFASMGFSIASSLALSAEQERLEQLKGKFDDAMADYKRLATELMKGNENLHKVTMTTLSKSTASARLEILLGKINNAISEATRIRDTWININDEVNNMRIEAESGKDLLTKDEKKIKFEYVFNYLNATTTDWKAIQGLALTITNTFNN